VSVQSSENVGVAAVVVVVVVVDDGDVGVSLLQPIAVSSVSTSEQKQAVSLIVTGIEQDDCQHGRL
jgi:hypothetical protein